MTAANSDEQVAGVLICPDGELARVFAEAATASQRLIVQERQTVYPPARAVTETAAAAQATAVFVDVGTDRAQAVKLLKAVAADAPQLAVVALNRTNDPETILECLRSGAAEFLAAPFPAGDFNQALQRIAQRTPTTQRPDGGRRAKLIAFAPVKGGSGCTTLAANIAFQIAAQKPCKILLADMDLSGGVLSFLLRLRTPYTFIDALRHSSQLDQALWQSLVVRHKGVDILGAPERPEPPLIEPYPVQEMLDFARTAYDYLIADLGKVVDGVGMTAVSTADQVNLVCSTDMPSLFLMRRTIPLLEEMGVDAGRVRVLVNRFDKRSDLSTEDMERIFRAQVFAKFPDDPLAVLTAHREGSLAPENTELGRAVKKFAADEVGSGPSSAPSGFGALKQLLGGA